MAEDKDSSEKPDNSEENNSDFDFMPAEEEVEGDIWDYEKIFGVIETVGRRFINEFYASSYSDEQIDKMLKEFAEEIKTEHPVGGMVAPLPIWVSGDHSSAPSHVSLSLDEDYNVIEYDNDMPAKVNNWCFMRIETHPRNFRYLRDKFPLAPARLGKQVQEFAREIAKNTDGLIFEPENSPYLNKVRREQPYEIGDNVTIGFDPAKFSKQRGKITIEYFT